MTVVVACRAADGTLVFGSDQRFTSENEVLDGPKLFFHTIPKGIALIGLAAENANHGFVHMIDLQIALNNIAFDEDPIVVIRKRMKDTVSFGGQNEASKEVEILCGMASPFLQKQKLFIISDREIHEIDEKVFCCVGSGAGAASGFLHLASKSLSSLRDVQTAVFTSVWLAKKTDRRCGLTDIRWLTLDSGRGELESAHIEALESYIEPSLPEAVSRWIVSAPVGHQSSIPAQNLDKKI